MPAKACKQMNSISMQQNKTKYDSHFYQDFYALFGIQTKMSVHTNLANKAGNFVTRSYNKF